MTFRLTVNVDKIVIHIDPGDADNRPAPGDPTAIRARLCARYQPPLSARGSLQSP
jgi:hypothetical protein